MTVGRKEMQMMRGRGGVDLRERRERETDKAVQRELHRRNTCPKPLTGKTRAADHCFYNHGSPKSEVSEVY